MMGETDKYRAGLTEKGIKFSSSSFGTDTHTMFDGEINGVRCHVVFYEGQTTFGDRASLTVSLYGNTDASTALKLVEGMVSYDGLTRPSNTKEQVMRSCASCPEMANPDSYINHLHAALEWHDEHVPRPTNPRGTCVVLEGEKAPEEVLFVNEGSGVTHYLPEAACKQEDWSTEGDHARIWLTCGHDCMVETVADLPKFCPECGARVKEEAE